MTNQNRREISISKNAWGQLVCVDVHGQEHTGVHPVRAFPISARDDGVSIVNADGHEVAWVDRLEHLPESAQSIIQEALSQREFMPVILKLKNVSSMVTPSTWQVETSHGDTEFTLRGEEDIRRLSSQVLLVADSHGVQFLIKDLQNMDRHSKRLLDRFL